MFHYFGKYTVSWTRLVSGNCDVDRIYSGGLETVQRVASALRTFTKLGNAADEPKATTLPMQAFPVFLNMAVTILFAL